MSYRCKFCRQVSVFGGSSLIFFMGKKLKYYNCAYMGTLSVVVLFPRDLATEIGEIVGIYRYVTLVLLANACILVFKRPSPIVTGGGAKMTIFDKLFDEISNWRLTIRQRDGI